jgi:hypothetical protein
MAFPTGWERKCAITIADTNVDGDLSNFTVVLNEDALPSEMFDADGSYPALEGGGDIRFSSDYDGANQLPCDIRAFHIDNDPANGYANIAVKVPSILASGGATIYVWYNKAGESQPAAADTYGQYNAYDGDFIGVWPLIESGNGTAGEFKDRTSNQINGQGGSGTGSKVPTQEDGDVYKRQSFDGTDDHVDLNNSGANDFNFVQNSLVFTWEGLIGIDNLSSRESIFRNTGSTAEKGFTLCWETNAAVGYDALRALIVKGSSGTPVIDCRSPDGTTITDTNPHHVAFRGNGSGNSVLFYVDGVQKATTVSTAFSSLSTGGTTNDTLLGRDGGATAFGGSMEEVRVSDVDRSAAWIKATSYSLQDMSNFASAGSPVDGDATNEESASADNGLVLFGSASASTVSGLFAEATTGIRFEQRAKTPAQGPSMFFQFEPNTARLFLWASSQGRLTGFDRLASSSSVVRTTPPTSLGVHDSFMVVGRGKYVGFLSTYSGGVRKGARGRWGYGADDSWTVADLTLDAYQYEIEGVAVDDENGWHYTLHVDTSNNKLVLARWNILTGASGQMNVPGVDDTNTPHSIWYDREWGYIWIAYDVGSDVQFGRFEWDGTTLTVSARFSTALVDITAFGRSGDMIIGYDRPSKKVFRFPWGAPTLLTTYGSDGDGTTTEGATNEIEGGFFCQWFNKLFLYDQNFDGADSWCVFSTEWAAMNWGYTSAAAQKLKVFGHDADAFGAAYDLLRDESYGGNVPAQFIDRVYLEAASGYANEYVDMTAGGFSGYAPRHALNISLADRKSMEALIKEVMSNVNGAITYQEGLIKAFIERPVQYTAHDFDRSNIKEDTMRWSITSRRTTPNRVTVDHRNRYDWYRHVPVQANEESSQNEYSQVIEKTYRMLGITLPAQASRMAYFLLDSAQANRIAAVFTVNIEGALVEVGDIIKVTHDKPGWTDEFFRILDIREMPNDEFQLSVIQHLPEIHRFSVGSIDDSGEDVVIPYQDPDQGIYGSNQFLNTVKPPVRFKVFEDREDSQLLFFFAYGEDNPGPVYSSSFSTKLTTDTDFNQVVAYGPSTVDTWHVVSDVAIDEEDEIYLDAPIPESGNTVDRTGGYVLIGDEIIRYEDIDDGGDADRPKMIVLKDLTRGQRGTVAAAHAREAAYTIDAGWELNTDMVAPNDATSRLTGPGTLGCLQYKEDQLLLGWTNNTPNCFRVTIAPGGDARANSALLFEYSYGDGLWRELPGIFDETGNFNDSGQLVHWDVPRDWVKTNKFLPGDLFPDGVARYYIRITQLRDNVTNPYDEPSNIVLSQISDCRQEKIAWRYKPEDMVVFSFPASMVSQARDWKGVAIGLNGEVSPDAANPVQTLTIQDLAAGP